MSLRACYFGVRAEHPQELVDRSQYGRHAGNRLLRWIKREHLRIVVFVFLLVIGIKYIFKF